MASSHGLVTTRPKVVNSGVAETHTDGDGEHQYDHSHERKLSEPIPQRRLVRPEIVMRGRWLVSSVAVTEVPVSVVV